MNSELGSADRHDLTRREVLGALALGLPAVAALAGAGGSSAGAWGRTEFQVNLKLGPTPSAGPVRPHRLAWPSAGSIPTRAICGESPGPSPPASSARRAG